MTQPPATANPTRPARLAAKKTATNYRPLVNSPRDGVDCFDQRTPAEQREVEENYIEIGHDPQTGMSFYAPKEAVERYGQAPLLAELA